MYVIKNESREFSRGWVTPQSTTHALIYYYIPRYISNRITSLIIVLRNSIASLLHFLPLLNDVIKREIAILLHDSHIVITSTG